MVKSLYPLSDYTTIYLQLIPIFSLFQFFFAVFNNVVMNIFVCRSFYWIKNIPLGQIRTNGKSFGFQI